MFDNETPIPEFFFFFLDKLNYRSCLYYYFIKKQKFKYLALNDYSHLVVIFKVCE